MRCLRSGKYDMRADILKQGTEVVDNPSTPAVEGGYVEEQDPFTGQIIRVWVPGSVVTPDDPNVPGDQSISTGTVKCLVRGHMALGAPTSDVSESWSGKEYFVGEFAKMWTPASVKINRRDRVYNIRDKRGSVAFVEDEFYPPTATIYDVVGVTPIIDKMVGHVENFVMLQRASIQGDSDA